MNPCFRKAAWQLNLANVKACPIPEMRILYILPFVPWSVRVRSSNLIPRLARRHTIDLVCLANSEHDLSKLNGIRAFCATTKCRMHSKTRALLQVAKALPTPVPLRMAYASSPAMEDSVRRLIESSAPDLIYIERWRGLQYVPLDCSIPVLCDPTDCMILYNKRLITGGSWWERMLGIEEYVKFLRYEPALARRANLTIFCSRLDRDCLLRTDPTLNCDILPNGVDCGRFFRKQDGEAEPGTIIFTGNFGYRPNVHAAVHFLERVFPAIQRGYPKVKFVAVGNAVTSKLKKYMNCAPSIELIDFVPDLRPHLARATVAVAPLTVGVGVSNKVLEAFSVGTPIVATALACGDLPARDGKHLFLASHPALFAERVLELLHNSSLRAKMADEGRTLVERDYDWEILASKLENLMHQVARGVACTLESTTAQGPHTVSVN
jgi:polysaccharide biosynthesis protein PslH